MASATEAGVAEVLASTLEALKVAQTDMTSAWLLLCGMFGISATFGVACLRAGSVNRGSVQSGLFQLLGESAVGAVVWWLFGYGVAFGSGGAFIATDDAAMAYNENEVPHFFASLVYLGAALSVVSGGVTCRLRLEEHLGLVVWLSGFVFPVVLHWTWSASGWLSDANADSFGSGVHDISGTVSVFVFGAAACLGAAWFTGPRTSHGITMFSKEGAVIMEPHNRQYQAAGLLFIWACRFALIALGFGTTARDFSSYGAAVFTAALGSGTGVIAGLVLSRELTGYYDIHHLVNSAMASLVATSNIGYYASPTWAPLVATVAVALYFVSFYAVNRLQLDDPFSAITTGLLPGAWGSIAISLLAEKSRVTAATGAQNPAYGLFMGGGGELLGTHLMALLVVTVWAIGGTIAVLALMRYTVHKLYSGDLFYSHADKAQHGGNYCDFTDGIVDPKERAARSNTMTTAPFEEDEKPAGPFGTKVKDPSKGIMRAAVCLTLLSALSGTSAKAATHDAVALQEELTAPLMKLYEQSTAIGAQAAQLASDLDAVWILISGIIVFNMQLGFCLLEAGCVRSGNVINIVFKNFADCSFGGIMWWLVGFAFAYGPGSFIGADKDRFAFSPEPGSELFGDQAFWFLSFTYMITAITIISGAVAERISLKAYIIIVVFVSGFFYPVVVHSFWSADGWLSIFSDNRIFANGVLDASGSVVIHQFGGACALVLAWFTGPRVLKGGVSVFSEEGRAMVMPHNKFQVAIGTLLLWFAWFAFNAAAVTVSGGMSQVAANAVITTCIAGAMSTVVGIIVSAFYRGHYDVLFVCNCALTGLVAITSGCTVVSPYYAVIIGAVAVPVLIGGELLTTKLSIDDVVGAGAVHFGGGAWGGIATGLFCDQSRIRQYAGSADFGSEYGLFLGGGGEQFAIQLIGVVVVAAWAVVASCTMALLIRFTVGFRYPEEHEYLGLDITHHKAHSYDYIEGIEAGKREAQEQLGLTNAVADALACFDLELARQTVASSNNVQPALGRVIDSLQPFKPYLPLGLFDDAALEKPVATPGSDSTIEVTEGDGVGKEKDVSADSSSSKKPCFLQVREVPKPLVATCAHLRANCTQPACVDEPLATMDSVLCKVLACLTKTDGAALSVMGTSIIATWNTSKRVADHNNAALRFMSLFHQAEPLAAETSTGIASGPVSCGDIGPNTQRFVAVAGRAIELCNLLATAAVQLGARCLQATVPGTENLASHPASCMRPIQTWVASGSLVNVFEIRTTALSRCKELFAEVDTEPVNETEGEADWAWGPGYAEAFNAKQSETIKQHTSDPIALKVALALASSPEPTPVTF